MCGQAKAATEEKARARRVAAPTAGARRQPLKAVPDKMAFWRKKTGARVSVQQSAGVVDSETGKVVPRWMLNAARPRMTVAGATSEPPPGTAV